MKKFKESDIFHNVIKTYPKIRIFCYNGKIYYNTTSEEGVKLNNFLNNFLNNSQQEETPPPAFDFEEQFSYAGGWPGVFENVNYDWNPADGEESLATPDFQENDFTYTSDWPGVFENENYDWNPADGEESLATPDFQEDFDTITGGW